MRNLTVPGSLLDPRDLAGQPICGMLRAALRVLMECCEASRQRLVLIARPEIFTHGETLAWLMRELGNLQDHVAVSDGSTIQLIPGLRNHLFFYNPGLTSTVQALDRYVGRAPEVPQRLAGQINTNFTFRRDTYQNSPPPSLLQAKTLLFPNEAEYRRFYLNPNSITDSVSRSESAPAVQQAYLSKFINVSYIPFTIAATDDMSFCRLVVSRILAALRQPDKLLILGAPLAQTAADDFSQMLSHLLQGINRCGTILPRATLANVVVASTLVDEVYFAESHRRSDLLLHDSFAFWRCPISYYGAFDEISLAIAEERLRDGSVAGLIREACGKSLNIVPLGPMRRVSIRSLQPHE
jgi:hypothetical protein